jgi:hypothetical protein
LSIMMKLPTLSKIKHEPNMLVSCICTWTRKVQHILQFVMHRLFSKLPCLSLHFPTLHAKESAKGRCTASRHPCSTYYDLITNNIGQFPQTEPLMTI